LEGGGRRGHVRVSESSELRVGWVS
jgi:hypothetical protein